MVGKIKEGDNYYFLNEIIINKRMR